MLLVRCCLSKVGMTYNHFSVDNRNFLYFLESWFSPDDLTINGLILLRAYSYIVMGQCKLLDIDDSMHNQNMLQIVIDICENCNYSSRVELYGCKNKMLSF